ncbi:MAG: S-layer homology domain-containing protein [Clostridia bacterium]|nr:S-layer homology domain-containing protein [Clostridia bacterium]
MKKLLALIITAILLSPTVLAGFIDMPDNWSTAALQSAADRGLMNGSNGYIYPDKSLTRAELATILNRALGNTAEGDISHFSDVNEGDWFYHEMAKAYKAGLFLGDGKSLNPSKAITREEAMTVMARAYSLSSKTDALSAFKDKDDVSSWAKESVNALVSAGIINGSNGRLNPKNTITRAEFAQVLYNLDKIISDDEGNWSEWYE